MEAGLPNITGNFMAYGYRSGNTGGAFSSSVQAENQLTLGTGEGAFVGFMLNASRSSSIYGNSDTVTPLSISSIFVIKY